ncbi:hypothetical protein DM01DRAFT_1333508 [Hesseltinella vesiculosa]|uniref:Uncharacterized protein n=1 Tax=Hesseltinella vesiculosa TaxID=101127 RepID=A0A1X2GPZ1_9FUNG|nr:hypothetical protein DM01DRAFT_1333508 [Hesseltinella vesiculosa]
MMKTFLGISHIIGEVAVDLGKIPNLMIGYFGAERFNINIMFPNLWAGNKKGTFVPYNLYRLFLSECLYPAILFAKSKDEMDHELPLSYKHVVASQP